MFERIRIPFATPETAEIMVAMVSRQIITIATVLPVFDQPVTISTPREICSAPIPSDAAVPNSVATIAMPSITREGIVNALIDLPFALPTIVASLVLLSLYGPDSPVGITINATQPALVLALTFVTLPFVVRAVQPVLIELDRDVEEAAASLGASNVTIFLRIVLPALMPALLSGGGLAFARAIGEYGSVVLIGGNIPGETQVASQYIQEQIESDLPAAAASVSVTLLAITFVVLIVLRLLSKQRGA